jgi:hypothetical protein
MKNQIKKLKKITNLNKQFDIFKKNIILLMYNITK